MAIFVDMQHRLNFKIIGILITLSFLGLVLLQGHWLTDMYRAAKEQNRLNIEQALEEADHKELFMRLAELKMSGQFEGYAMDFSENMEAGITPENIRNSDTLSSKVIQLHAFLKELPNSLLYNIHQVADTLLPINFPVFEDLLNAELLKREIRSGAFVKVYTEQQLRANPAIAEGNGKDFLKGAYRIEYAKFPHAPQQRLFAYILHPDKQILLQMRGILSTSVAVLLLIIATFIYLFRTIMKQKSIEELKTDFTNNMTHELKTPIAAGYAAVDALLRTPAPVPAEKLARYLLLAKGQLIHLSGLVEQILSLAVENRTLYRLTPEPVCIEEVITQLTEQHTVAHKHTCIFCVSCPPGTEIIGDRTHIHNMLNNLIDNAIKYGGKPVARITIAVQAVPGHISISVTDNGPGIQQKERERIFEKFYRIPTGNLHNIKGHGLGLYYVKDMMARHEGCVTVTSEPGQGACFTLIFKM